MTDLSEQPADQKGRAANKIRFVTAASLFDGHDASINIMRRILQASGVEVIHLGHNRSVDEIVNAAIQEDVQGIAISSYQGGHVEYFKYTIDLLRERGGENIKVFGGGGGVIVPDEIEDLHRYGVARIYTPEDGARMGLQGMITDMIRTADRNLAAELPANLDELFKGNTRDLARVITGLENTTLSDALQRKLVARAAKKDGVPVLGITGTGGSDQGDALRIAVIAVDPSRRKTGGALLGDRIRMNSINHPNIYMRSLATRDAGSEIAACLPDVIAACKCAGFDLVLVETSGIGQGDAAIVPHVDFSLYVMTPEFGAASQLEKIDMLDFADFVSINKFDRRGAQDALRDVRKQMQRNRGAFTVATDAMPVFGTIASRFNDDGVTALYQTIVAKLKTRGLKAADGKLKTTNVKASSGQNVIVPPARARYLAEIAETVRGYHADVARQSKTARERQQLREARRMLDSAKKASSDLAPLIAEREKALSPEARALLEEWPQIRQAYSGDEQVTKVRDREIRTTLKTTSLSGTKISKVALPKFEDDGETLKWLMRENLPGYFPYTAGVFAFKRENEDPTRMFAGEGDPFRTNARFQPRSIPLRCMDSIRTSARTSTARSATRVYRLPPWTT